VRVFVIVEIDRHDLNRNPMVLKAVITEVGAAQYPVQPCSDVRQMSPSNSLRECRPWSHFSLQAVL
jgi:hypothetical protein